MQPSSRAIGPHAAYTPPEHAEGDTGAHALWEFQGDDPYYQGPGGDSESEPPERLSWNAAWPYSSGFDRTQVTGQL